MLESIEGKRGLPRHKPPYPFQVGLFGLPTLINNIETLWWVRDIVEKGAQWFVEAGRPRFYSVSGRVKEPGVKRAPSGITIRRLIDEYCGGMDCAPFGICIDVPEPSNPCNPTGCSGQLCAPFGIDTTCEWLPHYACYQDANCGPFGLGGACTWEHTPELSACLAAAL